MAGLISNIVGGNVEGELEKLLSKLVEVEKDLDTINGKAITLKVDLQGTASLSELTNLYKQQEEVLAKLRGTAIEYVDTYKMATDAISKHNGQTQKVVAVSNTLSKTLVNEAKARKENAKAILDEQKYTAALNKEKERQEEKANKARIAAEKETNAYIQLRNEYNKQSTELKGMIVQYGEADGRVKKMTADVMLMRDALLKAEQAVGQHQRKVGQYENAAFAMSQIIREAPAFAYGINVGIGALSNNLPILFDQFKRLREEVGSTSSALKIMGTSIFSFTNIFTIAYTALMLFTSGMIKFGSAADEMKNKLTELEHKSLEHAEAEKASAETLLSIAKDVNQSYEIRLRAVKELQDKYPDYLGHLSQEAILAGNVANEMERLNDALKNKALYQASLDKISEFAKQYIQLSDELQQLQGRLVKETRKFDELNNQSTNQYAVNARTRAAIDKAATKRNIESIKEQIKATQDGMDKYQKLANSFAGKAAPLILKPIKEDRDNSRGKEKKETINDDLENAKKAYELQLLLNKQKFLNSRQTYTEEEQLNKDNLKATTDYGEQYVMIVEDFNNRVGMSKKDFDNHMIEGNKILIDALNDAKEKGDKIQEEIIQKHIKANEKLQKLIDDMTKKRIEIQKINSEIEAVEKKRANRKAYAEGIDPILEGLGFTSGYKNALKQKKLEIAAQREQLDLTKDLEAAEGVKGDGADPVKLMGLQENTLKEQKKLNELEAEQEEIHNQQIIEAKKEVARQTIKLAQETFAAIQTIRNNEAQQQQMAIDRQLRQLHTQTEQQMRMIDAKAGFEASKTNEKTQLAAQAAAKENELQAKSNQLAFKTARANKQMAQAQIILNTAMAITKAFVQYGFPAGVPIAAIIAATGAVQYAAASSTPLPQFEKGGTTQTSHFIAGEKGSELMITPSGEVSMSSDTAKIHTAPIGTKIIPNKETENIIKYASKTIGISAYDFSMMNAANHEKTIKEVAKIVGDKFEDVAQDIIHGMFAARPKAERLGQTYIDAVREQQNLISKGVA
jgi:hypothetical protein